MIGNIESILVQYAKCFEANSWQSSVLTLVELEGGKIISWGFVSLGIGALIDLKLLSLGLLETAVIIRI